MKSTPEKDNILSILAELSRKYPDMRFGQLVANVAYWAKGPTKTAVWDVADEEFLKAAHEHLERQSVK